MKSKIIAESDTKAYQCQHCGKPFVVPSLARHHEQTCKG